MLFLSGSVKTNLHISFLIYPALTIKVPLKSHTFKAPVRVACITFIIMLYFFQFRVELYLYPGTPPSPCLSVRFLCKFILSLMCLRRQTETNASQYSGSPPLPHTQNTLPNTHNRCLSVVLGIEFKALPSHASQVPFPGTISPALLLVCFS